MGSWLTWEFVSGGISRLFNDISIISNLASANVYEKSFDEEY